METPIPPETPRPRPRWGRIIAGGTVLGLTGVVAGKLLFPQTPEPPLLRGLPQPYNAATRMLTDRTRARFPVGTPESQVIAELRTQGFTVSPPMHNAAWRRDGMPCVEIANVWWSVEQGRVTRIEGLRNAICS